jgi:polysaccharide pyruvyl transferase WcaK-like protein
MKKMVQTQAIVIKEQMDNFAEWMLDIAFTNDYLNKVISLSDEEIDLLTEDQLNLDFPGHHINERGRETLLTYYYPGDEDARKILKDIKLTHFQLVELQKSLDEIVEYLDKCAKEYNKIALENLEKTANDPEAKENDRNTAISILNSLRSAENLDSIKKYAKEYESYIKIVAASTDDRIPNLVNEAMKKLVSYDISKSILAKFEKYESLHFPGKGFNDNTFAVILTLYIINTVDDAKLVANTLLYLYRYIGGALNDTQVKEIEENIVLILTPFIGIV